MSEQSAGTGGTQGNSDNDRKVRDILDRVAAGQLSSEEAAILLAAGTTPTTAPTARHAEPGPSRRPPPRLPRSRRP